jgi:hypothetical protein
MAMGVLGRNDLCWFLRGRVVLLRARDLWAVHPAAEGKCLVAYVWSAY